MEKAQQKNISKKRKAVLLIIFSAICWGFFWESIWQYLEKIINFSPEALMASFAGNGPHGKLEMENLLRIAKTEFYIPHLFFILFNLIVVPSGIGIYIGRHSEDKKYLNVVITVALVFLFRPILDFLFQPSKIIFLPLIIFSYVFFILPFFVAITSFGALIGSYVRHHDDKGLYLHIYQDILSTSKRSIPYLFLGIFISVLNLQSAKTIIDNFLSPRLHYFYAPVSLSFNGYHIKIIREIMSGYGGGGNIATDPKYLENGDYLELEFPYTNNNHLYQSKNTTLALGQPDETHFIATLWADNVKLTQKSVEIIPPCRHPQFTYIDSRFSISRWQPETQIITLEPVQHPFPFGQRGQEIFNPNGFNVGDMEAGSQGNFTVKFQYNCFE